MIAIDSAVEAEILNWVAWCHSGRWPHPIPPDKAASAEGMFVDPSDLYAEPPRPRPPQPNEQRALVVQRVYMEQLTPRERKVLVGRYIRRENSRFIARRLRLTVPLVDEAILRSARRIGAAFRMESV